MPAECESAVGAYITCVRVRVRAYTRGEGKQKETGGGGGGGAAARQFGRVLCGRHVGHIAGERGFLMTTHSIGSMVPPPPFVYARVNTHRRRDVTDDDDDDGISVGTDPTTDRAVSKQPSLPPPPLPTPPTTKPPEKTEKKMLGVDAFSATSVRYGNNVLIVSRLQRYGLVRDPGGGEVIIIFLTRHAGQRYCGLSRLTFPAPPPFSEKIYWYGIG